MKTTIISPEDYLQYLLSQYLLLAGGVMAGQIMLPGGGAGNQACTVAQAYAFSTGTSVLILQYKTDTTAGHAPANGRMQWETNPQVTSPNTITVSNITSDGLDLSTFLATVLSGSEFLIQDKDNSANFQKWVTTADAVQVTGGYSFAADISVAEGLGVTGFPDNYSVLVSPKASSIPLTTDELAEGIVNLYFTNQRAQEAVAQANKQVLYGTGTSISSSSGFTFDPLTFLLKVSGGSPIDGSPADNSTDFASGRIRSRKTSGNNAVLLLESVWTDAVNPGYAKVLRVTDTASLTNSFVEQILVNNKNVFQVRKDGAVNYGVDSITPFSNSLGAVIALAEPTTQPSTASIANTVILSWNDTIKRIQQIDSTATVLSYITTADLSSFASTALLKANNLSDLASVSTARSNLGLGTAATYNYGDFDPAGAAAAAQAAAIAACAAKGANSDITSLSGLTGGIATPTYVSFSSVSANPTALEGRTFYDNTAHTLSVFTDIGTQPQHLGRELWIRVRNQSGAPILNGKAVYISDATGQTPLIELAKADAATTAFMLGVVCSGTIANNGFGYVCMFGEVGDLNTAGFLDGALVYLSATTAGEFTATAPTQPNYQVLVGFIEHSHITQGQLLVRSLPRYVAANAIVGSIATSQISGLVKGATSNQIIKANAAGSYADITSTYTVATADANSYLRVGSGTFTITIPADTLGAALESNSQIMIPWRKIGTGTTTFAVSGSGAALTLLGGGTAGTALTGACGVICVESTTVVTITGTA